jgi:ZIP family zinc transporter
MSFAQTVSLGAIAGFTIYLGLPISRLQKLSPRVRSFLTGTSAGILLFLLFDIVSHVEEPIETAVRQAVEGKASATDAILFLIIFVIGFGVGLLGLVAFESRFLRARVQQGQPAPAQLALIIATGLGVHNFSEGLAIGQSAVQGELALASLLIVGFALHNAMEGFGIVGPLTGTRPSWNFLGLLGLIGGGPTFVGTVAGYSFTSPAISILFLALAAGAILYVIGELYHVARQAELKTSAAIGLLVGFLVANGTELILEMSGP